MGDAEGDEGGRPSRLDAQLQGNLLGLEERGGELEGQLAQSKEGVDKQSPLRLREDEVVTQSARARRSVPCTFVHVARTRKDKAVPH